MTSTVQNIAIDCADPCSLALFRSDVVLGAGGPAPPVAVMVSTSEADPVRGTIDVSRLCPVDPSAVRAPVGKLVPDTPLWQVDRALRTYFDLL